MTGEDGYVTTAQVSVTTMKNFEFCRRNLECSCLHGSGDKEGARALEHHPRDCNLYHYNPRNFGGKKLCTFAIDRVPCRFGASCHNLHPENFPQVLPNGGGRAAPLRGSHEADQSSVYVPPTRRRDSRGRFVASEQLPPTSGSSFGQRLVREADQSSVYVPPTMRRDSHESYNRFAALVPTGSVTFGQRRDSRGRFAASESTSFAQRRDSIPPSYSRRFASPSPPPPPLLPPPCPDKKTRKRKAPEEDDADESYYYPYGAYEQDQQDAYEADKERAYYEQRRRK